MSEEQRLEAFKEALSTYDYSTAKDLAVGLERTTVCYYTSFHIDKLLAADRLDQAKEVCKIIGRNTCMYLEDKLK